MGAQQFNLTNHKSVSMYVCNVFISTVKNVNVTDPNLKLRNTVHVYLNLKLRNTVHVYTMVVLELQQWKAPLVLQLLVVMVLNTTIFPRPTVPDLTFVELFAGKGVVSTALREGGGNGSSHDINISPRLDLTSTAGFLSLGVLFDQVYFFVMETN